jgi:hypothetical protein
MDVYLEVGKKKVFASGIEWPGWCRWGRDEASALQTLIDYGPRYAQVLEGTNLRFIPPEDVSQLKIVERTIGGSTTDFGAPETTPSSDLESLEWGDLNQFKILLQACWQAFDSAISAAEGKELRKGPRGGGREVEAIIQHVLGAESGYLGGMARRHKINPQALLEEETPKIRSAILDTLTAAQRGELPEKGPRGGVIWKPRYFVRRVAWHILDHTWEIEDRIT